MARVEGTIEHYMQIVLQDWELYRAMKEQHADRLMCGRFTNKLTWEEIVRLYRLPPDARPRNVKARYNICPTDPVEVVVERESKRELLPLRWGLVPRWWNKPLKEMKQLRH